MENNNSMNKLSYKIMLDRYSEKDLNKRTLKTDSIVIATVDETNSKYPQKEICRVTKMLKNGMLELVNIFEEEDSYILHRDKVSVPTELDSGKLWDRLALGNAKNEPQEHQSFFYDEFTWLLSDWKFVPGGRIMAMLGSANQHNLTAYNCYVVESPKDSRGGAIETLNTMIEIMSRGGGVGINISTIRPRNAIVRGVNGISSGAVSWGGGYSYYTGLVEQGGSRRGALLEGLAVWHPDIVEFINIKKNKNEMLNANLSVLITEDFMDAVFTDRLWALEFPDTSFFAYKDEWDGNLTRWKNKGYPTIIYKTLPAKQLWDMIIESNWSSAEPGIIWIERYNEMSNSWYFEQIAVTNPCGEMGLPPWGVCNLGHVNLAKVPLNESIVWGIDWNYLEKVVRLCVRFMDNIIDITPYFFSENEISQKNTRRIGIGTMGFAELLIKLKIRYGSENCLSFIDKLYSFIMETAYDESVELAKEKGPFPLFDAEKYLQGKFIQQLSDPLKSKIKTHGIRNVSLLTQAPTGSTGTVCDTSTGIEPFYDWVYYRTGRLGTEIQVVRVVDEYYKMHPEINTKMNDFNMLPDYFVTAKQLTPLEHITVMARIQKYVDSSISKTVNCPADCTVEQVDKLYRLAYNLGCKGLTIYRDKSRDTQVLNSIDDKPKDVKEIQAAPQIQWGDLIPKPKDTIYRLVKFNTGCGCIKLMIGTAKSLGNKVIDIYTIVNSEGGCQLSTQGLAISISKYLRLGGNIESLLENSVKAGNCGSYQYQRGAGRKDLYGKSCFNAIVRAVVDFQQGKLPEYVEVDGPPYEGLTPVNNDLIHEQEIRSVKQEILNIVKNNDNICPACGETMIKETGCWICHHCGYSKCE